MIRVMLVDDHEIVRNGLRMLLETFEEFEVVCEAENGLVALKCLTEIELDLILLDLCMPEMDGLTFLKSYKEQGLSIPVVILTTLDDQEKILNAMKYGAKSYMLKDVSRDTLYRTLIAAVKGEVLMTEIVMDKLLKTETNDVHNVHLMDFDLTERELYILTLVAKGDINRSIAIEMGISERTVKAHLTHIYSKMDVSSRSEAVAKALANKLIHV